MGGCEGTDVHLLGCLLDSIPEEAAQVLEQGYGEDYVIMQEEEGDAYKFEEFHSTLPNNYIL